MCLQLELLQCVTWCYSVLHGVTGADGHRTKWCVSTAGQAAAGAVTQYSRVLHGVTDADGHRTK